ncbi:MAG: metalloregulator ArsR/SmtB family transcription factor [Deltaproteobacteria bacterium]|nr:metalloregulator ArsR/SmtB family transcription factor [Deltaproteobacteria bacterium]
MSAKPHQSRPIERIALFRALGDAGRLRLLAICAEEELSVSELAEILRDSQPQISRRAAPFRQLGLLKTRRDGTRVYLRLAPDAGLDPIVVQALTEGRRLAMEDGSFARMADVLQAREDASRAFFDAPATEATADDHDSRRQEPFLAHLGALSSLLPGHRLAVDVGCGDGPLLELLAPLFDRVIGVDRSPAQLARAAERVRARRLAHVRLYNGGYDDVDLIKEVDGYGGADLVFASRVLHHAARPGEAMRSFERLLSTNGRLIVVDYLPHDDESMRSQGDVWLGLPPKELDRLADEAGLRVIAHATLNENYHPGGPDAHLTWQVMTASPKKEIATSRQAASTSQSNGNEGKKEEEQR